MAAHALPRPALPYADYFANLVVVRAPSADALKRLPAAEAYRLLRPYGGVAVVLCPDALRGQVEQWLDAGRVPAAECQRVAGGIRVRRGALPGAGEWTHQYADPGKSAASAEQGVRLPLKALWFGGMGPAQVVSRHFRAPSPLVAEGRCFVAGTDHLIATDIYNGRVLWQREIPDLAHWPAAYRGPSVAVDHQAVYAVQGNRCLRLDPATGKTLAEYRAPLDRLPGAEAGGAVWEYLAVTGDLIVGALGEPNVKKEWWSKAYPVNHLLFALEKQTGAVRWVYRAEAGVDSNAIAIEGGRLFLIDGRPRYPFFLRGGRAGETPDARPRKLKALDLRDASLLWETDRVRPTQNSLWAAGAVVLATQNAYSRTQDDPGAAQAGGGVCAYDARDGARLWQIEKVNTLSPVIIGGTLYLPHAYDLRTGEAIPRRGEGDAPFVPNMPRACSILSGCPNVLMSRSGSLGFFDLRQRSGFYHYPIVRAGCWINMIPAGGVVVVPEGSSSCTCAYNYKTSMAFVSSERQYHYGVCPVPDGPALRLSFGAPGDRPDKDGRIWYAYPRPTAVGRPLANGKYGPKRAGAQLPVEEAGGARVYGRNPDWTEIGQSDMPWLYSCGLAGPARLSVRLDGETPGWRVTLFFCEMEEGQAARAFDVKLQGRMVLAGLNVAREAGGARLPLAREFTIAAAPGLTLELSATTPGGPPPILSGMSIEPLAAPPAQEARGRAASGAG